MGFYIDPKNGTKEDWLFEHALLLAGPPDWATVRQQSRLPVCLVNNGMFTAAGVCFSPDEQDEFARPDRRPKLWFSVPIKDLYEVGALPQGFAVEELGT